MAGDDLADSGSVVYFVRPGNSGSVKIGFSARFDKRLRNLQSANPLPLQVLLTLPGGMSLEGQLHERFKAYRRRSEWFNLSDEIKAFIRRNGGVSLPPKGSWRRVDISDDEVRMALDLSESGIARCDESRTIPAGIGGTNGYL